MSNIPPLPTGSGSASQQSQRVLCGVMGILLGGLGIHRFVLGDITGGVLRILLSFFCFVGGIIGLIEGIIYLTKSDEEFIRVYQVEKKAWF
jgi:TM2 domain-containing membrane protein YozV